MAGSVCDMLDNLNIKDSPGDIETALESLKLQVRSEETHLWHCSELRL